MDKRIELKQGAILRSVLNVLKVISVYKFQNPRVNGVNYPRQLQKRTDKQRHLCFFLGIYLIIGVDLEIIALWFCNSEHEHFSCNL